MSEKLLDRTRGALGEQMIERIQKLRFCVVGCGGTGALFAEMLVRTGALDITLVDGDRVEESNLNRVLGFLVKDTGRKKVEVLKSRFEEINPVVSIKVEDCHLRKHDPEDTRGQKVRDSVHDSEIVIIAVDKNNDRIECEKLCRNNNLKTLGIGVYVDIDGMSGYEVAWCAKTPFEKKEEEGYGAGSYVSIVVEATAKAFAMLLYHLEVPNSTNYKYCCKSYKNYIIESAD